MKYEYYESEECFKRIDNRGRPLFVNISEARQIESYINLGYSVEEIKDKVKLSHPRAGRHTIVSIIKNIKEGNVDLTGDYMIPVDQLVEFTDSERISKLEKRVSNLEDIMSEIKSDCFISAFTTTKMEDESCFNKLKRRIGLV